MISELLFRKIWSFLFNLAPMRLERILLIFKHKIKSKKTTEIC